MQAPQHCNFILTWRGERVKPLCPFPASPAAWTWFLACEEPTPSSCLEQQNSLCCALIPSAQGPLGEFEPLMRREGLCPRPGPTSCFLDDGEWYISADFQHFPSCSASQRFQSLKNSYRRILLTSVVSLFFWPCQKSDINLVLCHYSFEEKDPQFHLCISCQSFSHTFCLACA